MKKIEVGNIGDFNVDFNIVKQWFTILKSTLKTMPSSTTTARARKSRRSKKTNKRPPKKGIDIRFITGEYVGFSGWTDANNGQTALMHYVIVDTEDGDIPTRVSKHSFVEYKEPTSYVEAMLDQHPDIHQDMKALCRKLAMCTLYDTDEVELGVLFSSTLHEAIDKNTKYRRVNWDVEEEEEEG
jgi:hypothetical protein